ncbi:MAG TPA: cytochrome c maturation protein CcmE [Actinomycetota bacterium]|jgi:cytochrome c-type biogenesis protein CcmE|nr:cytochrome c maturation protein CcmE [Actinomycetota bacterium]
MHRARVFVALAAIVAGIGWLAVKGLSSSLVYYQTPTDVLAKGQDAVGERARLGGYVLPGSVRRGGGAIRFVVSDGSARMSVVDTGGVPSLFQAGQGVVVEGALGRDGAFHADTVLVKHSSDYRPPSPGEAPHTAELQAGG